MFSEKSSIREITKSVNSIAYRTLVNYGIQTIGDLSVLTDSEIDKIFNCSHGNSKNKALDYRKEAIIALKVLESNILATSSVAEIIAIDTATQTVTINAAVANNAFTIEEIVGILESVSIEKVLIDRVIHLLQEKTKQGG